MSAPLFPEMNRCALVGMVHLLPLPGSPRWAGDMSAVLRRAPPRDPGVALEYMQGGSS